MTGTAVGSTLLTPFQSTASRVKLLLIVPYYVQPLRQRHTCPQDVILEV